jgi:acylphosphatase
MVKGEEEKLKELMEFCHKGPPLARVTEVLVEEIRDPGDLPHPFAIRY